MKSSRPVLLSTFILIAVLPVLASPGRSLGAAGTNALNAQLPPGSIGLEQAASAFADGEMAESAKAFRAIAGDQASPAFARSLALYGLTRISLEKHDTTAAVQTLRHLAEQSDLPAVHRDLALHRIAEIERRPGALPARDPQTYRASLPVMGEPGALFHVSPEAAPAGDGSETKPFGSLQQARDAIRQLKRSRGGNLPGGGVRVMVHGGAFHVSTTLNLSAEDSGSSNAPVVYVAKSGELPVFSGGRRILKWHPISDAKVREDLDSAVRGRVLEADLSSLSIKDLGDPTALRRAPELFCDGVPQTLARWPNEGFVKTGETLGTNLLNQAAPTPGCKDGKFRYVDDRHAHWVHESDVRLYGYWYWDWFEEFQKVAAIDPASHTVTLAPPFSQYGYRRDQRYRAVNVLAEIDQPGEWYLDRRTSKLYWLPPERVELSRAVVALSCCAEPFIVMNQAEHVILQGLAFQQGRGDAIHVQAGADCLVAGCTIRQFGGDGVVLDGGLHHGVFGCAISCMGCGGIRAKGGDRQTLTAGRHFIENCTVSDISRLKRTYTPAVLLDGCGNRVAHNLFEHMPSSALRIEGNDQLIELNLVRHVVQESDDQGALDIWGNPLYRGVVIRWNRWSDVTGGTHCGAAGVRLDDMISGVAIYGNVFERCGGTLFGAVQIHGGKDNLIDGNLFLECFAGISFTSWGEKRWLQGIENFLPQAASATYSQHYPELAAIKLNADQNDVVRNLFSRTSPPLLRGGRQRADLNFATEFAIQPATLADDQGIGRDAELRRLLLDPIPIPEIGPYPHPWRAPTPAARD